jgi:HEAT repeat protein
LAALIDGDSSAEVRTAAIRALADVHSEHAVEVLAAVMRSGDKAKVAAGADSLARLATPAALAALGELLQHGSRDAQGAAAYALKRSGTQRGVEILREQEETHPDEEVRKLCRIALGGSFHEH